MYICFFLLTLSKRAENCSGQIRNVVVPAKERNSHVHGQGVGFLGLETEERNQVEYQTEGLWPEQE